MMIILPLAFDSLVFVFIYFLSGKKQHPIQKKLFVAYCDAAVVEQ